MKTQPEISEFLVQIAHNVNELDAVCDDKTTATWFDGIRAAIAMTLTFIEEKHET